MRRALLVSLIGIGVLTLVRTLVAAATDPTPPGQPSADPLELLKWGGPWVAFVVYALKELRERRQVDEVLRHYEQMQQDHVLHLTRNTEALTQVVERLKAASKETGPLVEHLTYNTRVLTQLAERLEAWGTRNDA